MTDDWKPGDRAVCVDTAALTMPTGQVVDGGQFLWLGMIYLVRAVTWHSGYGAVLLDVHAVAGAKAARRFRKVPALADEQRGAGAAAGCGVGARKGAAA